jgi:hypothetical protein
LPPLHTRWAPKAMTDQPLNRRPQRRSGTLDTTQRGTGLQNLHRSDKSLDGSGSGGSGARALTSSAPRGASPSGAPAPSGLEGCKGVSGVRESGPVGAFRGRKGGRGASAERQLVERQLVERQCAQRLRLSLGLSQSHVKVGCWPSAVSVEIFQSILFRVLRARARHVCNCRAHPPFLPPPRRPPQTHRPRSIRAPVPPLPNSRAAV